MPHWEFPYSLSIIIRVENEKFFFEIPKKHSNVARIRLKANRGASYRGKAMWHGCGTDVEQLTLYTHYYPIILLLSNLHSVLFKFKWK